MRRRISKSVTLSGHSGSKIDILKLCPSLDKEPMRHKSKKQIPKILKSKIPLQKLNSYSNNLLVYRQCLGSIIRSLLISASVIRNTCFKT